MTVFNFTFKICLCSLKYDLFASALQTAVSVTAFTMNSRNMEMWFASLSMAKDQADMLLYTSEGPDNMVFCFTLLVLCVGRFHRLVLGTFGLPQFGL